MKPTYDKLTGKVLMHGHSITDLESNSSAATISSSVAVNMSEMQVVKAATYANNTQQASFTIDIVAGAKVGNSTMLLLGKLAAGATVTLPSAAEIINGAWSFTYRNVAEIYCYETGKYMVSIIQKTQA